MQHKGEIVEKAVRESGYSITKLAAKMGKSRRWVYQIFDNPNVPIDYVLEIGKIIHHDFNSEIKDLKRYGLDLSHQIIQETRNSFANDREEADFWKDKYLLILERYNELLLKNE